MTKIFSQCQTKNEAARILTDSTYEEDKLMEELEKEDEPSHIREKRLAALKLHIQTLNEMNSTKHGDYTEVLLEKDFLSITTKEKAVICHFYHKNFERCTIVHRHLSILAPRHFKVKFIKMNVEKCGFIVDKLKIKTLPAIYSFENGIIIDRLVGFGDLGNNDNFTTQALETRLSSLLNPRKSSKSADRKS
eukprot:Sdes_comp15828_c0_seq2m4908